LHVKASLQLSLAPLKLNGGEKAQTAKLCRAGLTSGSIKCHHKP
jgi:hypothetical protein